MSAQTILVIEDDASLREALLDKLKLAGYAVLSAVDGEDGLNTALKTHPALIVVDLLMPKMDGQTMLKQLRKDAWGLNVPVIVLSNRDANQDILAALEEGTLDYFIKAEISLKEIVEAIDARLAKAPTP